MLFGRGHRLAGQHINHRLLESGRQAIDRQRLTTLAIGRHRAQNGGLQPGEAEVVATRGPGSREAGRRPSVARRGADRRPPRIGQAEQATDLVKGLPGRIIQGLAEEPIAPVIEHQHQLRMPAADDQAEQRERRLGREWLDAGEIGQPVGIDVALDVIDRHERQVMGRRHRLGDADADQQRADQAGPVGDGHRIEIGPSHAGLLERRLHGRDDPAQLLTGRHLRHDAAGRRVERDLGGDLVRLDAPAAVDYGNPGLVAAGLDGQHPWPAHPSSNSARRARSASITERIDAPSNSEVVMMKASSPSSL